MNYKYLTLMSALVLGACSTEPEDVLENNLSSEGVVVDLSSSGTHVEGLSSSQLNVSSESGQSSMGDSSSMIEQSSSSAPREIVWNGPATDLVQLDFLVRDFPISHPDFEGFAAKDRANCPGEVQLLTSAHLEWANRAFGVQSTNVVGDSLIYFGDSDKVRGFKYQNPPIKRGIWEESVLITRDIFGTEVDTIPNQIEAAPSLGVGYCNSNSADQWFKDVPGVNYRSEQLLELRKMTLNDGTVGYGFVDDQFFPLHFTNDPDFGFGKQNIPEWCYLDEGVLQASNSMLCRWYFSEQDKNTQISTFPASTNFAANYHFSSVIATPFKYSQGDFIAIANDEFWVYVDGKLVFDGGGDHVPAEAILHLDSLQNLIGGDWSEGSIHNLQIFMTERQSDGSVMRIFTTIDAFPKAQFSQNRIQSNEEFASVSRPLVRPDDFYFEADSVQTNGRVFGIFRGGVEDLSVDNTVWFNPNFYSWSMERGPSIGYTFYFYEKVSIPKAIVIHAPDTLVLPEEVEVNFWYKESVDLKDSIQFAGECSKMESSIRCEIQGMENQIMGSLSYKVTAAGDTLGLEVTPDTYQTLTFEKLRYYLPQD